jgi:hypothetical protein
MTALDLYSRVRMGQFHQIVHIFLPYRNFDCVVAERFLTMAREEIFPELDRNAYYGIFNREVGDGQVTWDIYQVIRHAMAWHRNPNGGWTVDFDEPMVASNEPLPSVTIDDRTTPMEQSESSHQSTTHP